MHRRIPANREDHMFVSGSVNDVLRREKRLDRAFPLFNTEPNTECLTERAAAWII